MASSLASLGLSGDENELYLLLVDRPAATSEELLEMWTRVTSEAPVEDLIRSLQAKGLVTSLPGPPPRHAATAPDVALDNLASRREAEIAAARAQAPDLLERWRAAGRATLPDELIEIVVGREATLQRSEQIQRSASEEVLIIDAPPYAAHVVGNALESRLLARGDVKFRCLYDRSGLELPGKVQSILDMVADGEEARVANHLPLKLVMGDSSVAMVPLEAAPSSIAAALVVHPSSLLTSLRLTFDALWQTAVPVRGESDILSDSGGPGDPLTPVERQVVQLLVTGMTDQVIARQLGLAERTVQRKVQGLMRSLGVDNRLQLGMRLAELGWGR